jgi:transcriptional regulator with XRE-family HTH domain
MANPIDLEKLKKARGTRSRDEVAKALDLTRQQIFNYEKGKSEPPPSVLLKLTQFYGVGLNDVLLDEFLTTSLN